MQAIISETMFLARSRMQRLPFDPGPLDPVHPEVVGRLGWTTSPPDGKTGA
jgi:hypothetical protein